MRWQNLDRGIRQPRPRDSALVANAGSAEAAAFPDPSSQPTSGDAQHDTEEIRVLPRLSERDPFKILGIPSDSDFEEILQARNYLVEVRTLNTTCLNCTCLSCSLSDRIQASVATLLLTTERYATCGVQHSPGINIPERTHYWCG